MSIKRGDLVRIFKFCCREVTEGRTIFIVDGEWIPRSNPLFCPNCNSKLPSTAWVWAPVQGNSHPAFPVEWLKKIDPPATGEYDGVPVRKQIPRKETV